MYCAVKLLIGLPFQKRECARIVLRNRPEFNLKTVNVWKKTNVP